MLETVIAVDHCVRNGCVRQNSCRSCRVPGNSGEDIGVNPDLTCLIRAIVNQIACVDKGASLSDSRGDMSGLMYIHRKSGEDVGVRDQSPGSLRSTLWVKNFGDFLFNLTHSCSKAVSPFGDDIPMRGRCVTAVLCRLRRRVTDPAGA